MRRSTPYIEGVRFFIFYIVLIGTLLVFGLRLIQLQVFDYSSYVAQADENRTREVLIPAPRGVIYDRNGIPLAQNVEQFNVTITPAFLPFENEVQLQQIYQFVSEITGVPIQTPPLDAGEARGNEIGIDSPPPGIKNLVDLQDSIAPFTPVTVAPDVDREVALIIGERSRELLGVNVEVFPARSYPTGTLTSHIIGYTGPISREQQDFYEARGFDTTKDRIGFDGIEFEFQETLAGRPGKRIIEQDVAGAEIRTIDVVNPVPGENITLTIDIRLQAATKAALENMMDQENRERTAQGKTQVSNGVAIAMNPKTGEVLSMVSLPTYDNQEFARFIPLDYYLELADHPYLPLLNQAVSGEHPPGSVFKIALSAGALKEGIVSVFDEIFDPGKIVIRNQYFPNDPGKTREVVCWKRDGHGDVDFYTGLSQSCDIWFYAVGGGYTKGGVDVGMEIEGIYKYATMIGYNELTGIELPAERSGLIPDRDWKRLNLGENWSTGDTYIHSIGQGWILGTPIQIVNSFAPFMRNGDGILPQPTLVREFSDEEGTILQDFEPRVLSVVDIEDWILEEVDAGLRKVMVDGTGVDLSLYEGVNYAGKSGTAEYCDNIAQSQNRCKFGAWPAHAWFVAYAPWEDPEIAVVAFLYSGEEGSAVAGPVATEVINAYFELKAIDQLAAENAEATATGQ